MDMWCKVIVILSIATALALSLIGPGLISDAFAMHDWLTLAGYAIMYAAVAAEVVLVYIACKSKRGVRICTSS